MTRKNKGEEAETMNNKNYAPLEKKVWLASPTMHGEEIKFINEAYETNWGTKDNRDNR